MTTDTESDPPAGAGIEQPASGRLAAFLNRHLPVWRTVYILLQQVAFLRHQLAEVQSQLQHAHQHIGELREQDLHTNRRIDEACLRVDQAHQRVLEGEERIIECVQRVEQLREDLEQSGGHLRALDAKVDHAHQRVSDNEQRADEFGQRVALLHEDTERSGERLRALDDAIQLARRRSGNSDEDLLKLDEWYQDLQALHRGAPEAVLEVQKSYTAHFNERAWLRAAGPVVDLGCGRGEWLALMAQEGWSMRGVDSSEQAVREAREHGLDVELGDLVEFLEGCPDNSLSGVTAFQVIEHLPFGRITALMHAAYSALVPGGILLLETPNPENLQVSSYSFWLDPTHRHPIPPPLIMDLSYHVGFRDGSVLRKNPWPQWREQEAETSLESEVAYRLFGPQDYAILVYKPGSDAQ